MASGTIYGTTGNQYIDVKIEWSSIPSTDNETQSKVTAGLYYKRNNSGFTTDGTGSFSITINGTANSVSKRLTITEDAWVLAHSFTAYVTHDSDGTKTITISATGSIPNTTLTSTSCSGRATLDALLWASTITSVSNTTLGFACGVKWTPKATSLRYKVKFSLGSWSYTTGAIHPNTTAVYTYQSYKIPLAAANQIPNSKTGTMTATLYTYSDSGATSQVGSASSKTFTVTVPTTAIPTITDMSFSPVSSLGEEFDGLYVQGLSKVKVTSTEEGKYGATVVSKTITVENKDYGSDSNYTSDYLAGSGTIPIKLTIQDSRGYTNTETQAIWGIPYMKPSVIPRSGESSVVCARCDENGNLTDSGTYLRIKARRNYSPCLVDGVQKNFCGLRFRYKKYFGTAFSDWQNLLLATDNTTEEIDVVVLNGALETNMSYVVQVDAVDSIQNHAYVSFDVPTEEVYLHKAGSLGSLGIGEYVEGSNVISIAKSKVVRLKSNINGVRMYNRAVSGTTDLDIDTKYADFSGEGNERQTFFVFGEANGVIVYGVARVADNGATLWSGTDGVTLTTKTGGVLTVVLPKKAFDVFTIISGRDFTA